MVTRTHSANGQRNGLRQNGLRQNGLRQKTLRRPIPCGGVGLHSGVPVEMTLHPADADRGIRFRRTDVTERDPWIAARWDRVVDTRLCTVVGNEDGVTVGTVEHLMAALAGCEIDNAVIEIDAAEVPVMDGSSEPFVFLIECAGTVELAAPRRAIEIRKPVTVGDAGRGLTLAPDEAFSVDFEIDFASSVVAHSTLDVRLVNGTFKREIAKARTFGFLKDVEKLRAAGLGLGGSLENTVVVDTDRVLNEEGLRFDDEFVRHKVLDCVGDLYLAGAPILGRVTATKSGHHTNNEALRALFADPTAYAIVDMPAYAHADDYAEALPATA